MSHSNYTLLKRALLANASFSLVCGLLSLLVAVPIGAWMGIDQFWLLRAIGIGLVAFGSIVGWIATRPRPSRTIAAAICLADVGWVLGSAVLLWLLEPGALTAAGARLVAAIAFIVGAFAAAQWLGLSRLNPEHRSS